MRRVYGLARIAMIKRLNLYALWVAGFRPEMCDVRNLSEDWIGISYLDVVLIYLLSRGYHPTNQMRPLTPRREYDERFVE